MADALNSTSPDGDQRVDVDPSLWPLMNLTSDTSYVELRRKHYGNGSIDFVSPQGQPLGYFQRTRLPIKGIPVRFMSPLAGWESTGWLGCDRWTPAQWLETLNVIRQNREWDIFQSLWQSPEESARLRQAAEMIGMPHLNRVEPLRVIHGFRSWKDYVDGLGKRKRERCRSSLKQLEKHGLHVSSEVSYEQIRELFARRVLRMSDNDNAKSELYQEFLKDWMASLERDDRLETVGVWHGERLVAMALGFWRDRVFFFHFTAYDPEFKAASPGSIAIYKIIERALDGGAELFSFMGAFSYEKLYTSQILEFNRVDLFSRGLKGRCLHQLMKRKQQQH